MIAKIIMKNWPEYMSRNPKGLILLSLLSVVVVVVDVIFCIICFCNTLMSKT